MGNFPLFNAPFMAATFEFFNRFLYWKPREIVKIFQWFLSFCIVDDFINIGRIVEVGIPVARIKILVCLAIVLP